MSQFFDISNNILDFTKISFEIYPNFSVYLTLFKIYRDALRYVCIPCVDIVSSCFGTKIIVRLAIRIKITRILSQCQCPVSSACDSEIVAALYYYLK